MAVVSCPHCRYPIENLPTLAGQTVSCPHCRGQLQLPPLFPVEAVTTAADPLEFLDDTGAQRTLPPPMPTGQRNTGPITSLIHQRRPAEVEGFTILEYLLGAVASLVGTIALGWVILWIGIGGVSLDVRGGFNGPSDLLMSLGKLLFYGSPLVSAVTVFVMHTIGRRRF